MKIFRSKIFSNKQIQRRVQNSFLVFSPRDNDCKDVCIEEFATHYEVLVRPKHTISYLPIRREDLSSDRSIFLPHKKEKIDQFDLAALLYEFIASSYFEEDKPIIFFQSISLDFTKQEEFPFVFQKLQPLFI